MNEVIWVDATGMAWDNTIGHKLERLLDDSGVKSRLSADMRVALKIDSAEQGYEYGLRPSFIRVVADWISQATHKRPIVCDGPRLVDYWKRSKGNVFLEVASGRGYANETLGGHFVINGGFSGDEGDLYPCGTESELGGVEVGTAVCRSDALWVLSHVTLHPLFGMSGALLNGGFNCLTGRARTRLLDGLNPYLFNGQRPDAEVLETFKHRALESHLAVRTALESRVFYINYLWDITPQPEYYPYSEQPLGINLGFMAGTDPVAVDAATAALIDSQQQTAAPEQTVPAFQELIARAEGMGLGRQGLTIRRLS